MSTTSTTRRLAAAALAGALLLAGPLAGAVGAGSGQKPALTITGSGTWTVREFLGDAVVNGTGEVDLRQGRDHTAELSAVVQPDDRSLPAPGECEGAFATVTTWDDGDIAIPLVGMGEVCGVHVQEPFIVTHVFTGTFEVYGAPKEHRKLEGTDGFYEVRLANNGTAHVFAIDT